MQTKLHDKTQQIGNIALPQKTQFSQIHKIFIS